jgi:hypothetical protein
MPSVEVNLPNIPQGKTVSIPYLGKFTNGETAEVDQEVFDRYLRNHPGAADPEDGALHLTPEGMQEASKVQEAHEGTAPPEGEDPDKHSPVQTEGDDLSKNLESKLNDLNEEG